MTFNENLRRLLQSRVLLCKQEEHFAANEVVILEYRGNRPACGLPEACLRPARGLPQACPGTDR